MKVRNDRDERVWELERVEEKEREERVTRLLITRATIGRKHANYQEGAGQSIYKRESVQMTDQSLRMDDKSIVHFDLFFLFLFIVHCPLVSTAFLIKTTISSIFEYFVHP